MKNDRLLDPHVPDCPIRNILSRIGDKWSVLTLYTLDRNGTMRFSELRHAIPDISQKMLTATLRTLEEDGFLHRTVYAQVPPRVEYRLTDRALSLMERLNPLIDWALQNMKPILGSRADARTATRRD